MLVDAMQAEAKEMGMKASPFAEQPKAEAAKDETKADKAPQKQEETPVKEENTESRQSRAPQNESKETEKRSERSNTHLSDRIRKGLEIKFEEKYGKELSSLRDEVAQFKKGNLTASESSDLKEDIAKAAKDMNIKETDLEQLINLSRKSAEKDINDMKSRLAKYEERDKVDAMDEQVELFENEWGDIEPSLKEQFPNASKEQIAKAKEFMDEISHTDEYASADLDYIAFKNKAEFEKILFSPKQKTFESSSTAEGDIDSEKEEKSIFDSSVSSKGSFKDLEKMERDTRAFEESLPDTRFTQR